MSKLDKAIRQFKELGACDGDTLVAALEEIRDQLIGLARLDRETGRILSEHMQRLEGIEDQLPRSKAPEPELLQVGDWVRSTHGTTFQITEIIDGRAVGVVNGCRTSVELSRLTKIDPPARFKFGDRVRWDALPSRKAVVTKVLGDNWYALAFEDPSGIGEPDAPFLGHVLSLDITDD